MPESKRPLKVFLCHASQDKPVVVDLYERLKGEGWIDPWLDKENLLIGQDFDLEIEKAVETADAVIVFISKNAVNKTGYVQKELRLVYDTYMYKPEGALFAIPLRLEECDPPHRFKLWHWGDYFGGEKEKTYKSLLKSLKIIYEQTSLIDESPNVASAYQKVSIKANWSRKSLVGFIGLIASIIGIVVFVSGKQSLFEFFPKKSVTATLTMTSLPVTIEPTSKPTKTLTPTATPLPDEIEDAENVIMRLVPEGSFTMGSDSENDEGPVHIVSLNAFYIDKYEVSNALYKLCVDELKCLPPKAITYFGDEKYQNLPAVFINWDMAKIYCEWRDARLPTEAEWEKAARGENARIYPWGSQFDGSIVNFCDENCNVGVPNKNFDDGFPQLAPVDFFPESVSVYGLFNMAGNAAEWVSSLYKPYPYNPTDGRENLTVSGERLLRGGAWNSSNLFVRTTSRMPREVTLDIEKDLQSSGTGFRCASDANP